MQQDRVIARIFEDKRDGFFVDLAAHTPVSLSNTRTLERDFGWHGVCVEADHAYFVDLARYRACSVVQAVVASRANATVLYRHQASFGGVKRFEEGRRLGSHTPRVTGTSKLRTVTLTNVLRHAGAPSTIDYLSLDVEGFEMTVLKAVPWDKISFSAILIETFWLSDRIVDRFMTERGFAKVQQLAIDSLYLKWSQRDEARPWLPPNWEHWGEVNIKYRDEMRLSGQLSDQF